MQTYKLHRHRCIKICCIVCFSARILVAWYIASTVDIFNIMTLKHVRCQIMNLVSELLTMHVLAFLSTIPLPWILFHAFIHILLPLCLAYEVYFFVGVINFKKMEMEV